MTLIINVLHKDFSLLAADRQANASGPTTITIGNLRVELPNGGKIIGLFPKVITTANGTAALGSSGTTAEHTYLEAFKSATSAEMGLRAVRDVAHGFFDFNERELLLRGEIQMINSSITSFFDAEKDSFWSFIINYTRFAFSQSVYARRVNASAQIFSVGSGHDALARILDGEEHDKFIASITKSWREMDLALWLERCFKAVSDEDNTVGDTYDALIAHRNDPFFRPLARSE